MSRQRSQNVSMTVGDPLRLLIAFAIPMLLGNIFQQLYNIVDSSVVGKYVESGALATVGSTGSITFLFFSVSNGIGSGCGIITSQYFGASNDVYVRKSIANSAYLMFVSSFVIGIIAYIAAPPLLSVLKTPDEVLDDAVLYMRVNCLGVPLVAVYNFASSIQRSLGDSKTPLYFLIVSCFLNIAMDLLFVCVFKLAVFGVAIATVIAQFIAGIGCFIYARLRNPYFRVHKDELKPDAVIIRRAVRLGMPIAMQWSLIAVSSTALQVFVNGFGTAAMAAFTATNRVESLLHLPYGSVGSALSTFAGQNYGAHDMERVKDGIRKGLLLSTAFSILMLFMIHLLSKPIMTVFVDDGEVIAIGEKALRITSWFYTFLGIIYITRGALNGVGDVLFSFINDFVEMIGRIFIPMLIVLIPGIGIWGIWWTACLTWLVSALFCLMRYASWRKKNQISKSKSVV